jgi:hypothetical protein
MSDRGFIDWSPRGETKARLDMIRAILAEYKDFLPLTLRQIFYRAVGQHSYDKTEKAYKRLGYVAAKARRAGVIRFDAIRDDGVTIRTAGGFADLSDFQRYMNDRAKYYRRNRMVGQDKRLIVLCEAAGMVPQIARVAHEFGFEVRSSGGYDSVTAKYDLACDIIDGNLPTILLHLGDLDPSGEDMFTVIREDVAAFVNEMSVEDHGPGGRWLVSRGEVEAVRIAVTREQVAAMRLPSAPKKETDSRSKNFQGETVQCEAIPPDELNRIVTEEIRARLNMDAFEANRALEAAEVARIAEVMKTVSFMENRP